MSNENITAEAVNGINEKLNQVFTEEQQDELYLADMELHQRMVQESGIPEWVSDYYPR